MSDPISVESFESSPKTTTPSSRSSWPTVLGVFSIVVGGIGLVMYACGTAQGMGMLAMSSGTAEATPGVPAVSTAFAIWNCVNNLVLLIMGVMLVVGGIGLLMRKRWSVCLVRLWAWLRILTVVIGVVSSFVFQSETEAMMMAGMDGQASDPSLTDDQQKQMEEFQTEFADVIATALPYIVLGCSVLFLIFPVVTLVVTGRGRDEVETWG